MGSIGKGFSLLIVVILAASSLIMVESAFAQSIPKPSVPEFTLRFVDKSYDVPPTATSTTDPYNGKTTTTTIPGYHVKNFKIEVTIKNQPFPSTLGNNTPNLYYNIRTKGHFGEDWIYQYPSFPSWASSTSANGLYGNYAEALPTQSSSGSTVLSFPANYRSSDKVDFQVEAILGYHSISYNYEHTPMTITETVFSYNPSGWSPTQTFTMLDGSTSTSTPNPTSSSNPTTAPTSTPTTTNSTGNPISMPLNTFIAAVAVFLAILVALSLLLFRRHRKTTNVIQ